MFKFTYGDWIEENRVSKECGFGGRVLIFFELPWLVCWKKEEAWEWKWKMELLGNVKRSVWLRGLDLLARKRYRKREIALLYSESLG